MGSQLRRRVRSPPRGHAGDGDLLGPHAEHEPSCSRSEQSPLPGFGRCRSRFTTGTIERVLQVRDQGPLTTARCDPLCRPIQATPRSPVQGLPLSFRSREKGTRSRVVPCVAADHSWLGSCSMRSNRNAPSRAESQPRSDRQIPRIRGPLRHFDPDPTLSAGPCDPAESPAT